jgi:ABC-type multidrug transport system fused ATPase/permease subunit
MDWRLGIIAFVIGISILITSFKFAKPLRVQSDLIQKSLSNTTENLINVIQGLPVTKMFQLEQMTQRYYERSNAEWVKSKVRHCNLISAYNALRTVFEGLRNIGTLILGLYFFLQGSGSIGIIVASIHLQANAGYFFSNLSNTVTGIQTSFSGAGRIFDLMDTENEEKSRQVLKKPEFVQSKKDSSIIEIQNLSFNYTSSKNLIQKINLQVSKGELIAFVGESGGGKSTLIKLLLGLYPISSGNIMIQNRSIKEYTLTELRERTSYVPQNAFLFDGTIEDNIQYGNSHATKDEIIEAAKAAYAHDFIIQQKDGYNTLVGERGTHLSGGQRQRIAIARALLKNAPILLLDEATSALDSESEQLVQKALNSLMYGRTTLAVAHRLSTILHADNIYVIEEGQIMELGTHTELMNQGGKYEKLYNSQFGPSTI